MTDTQTAFVLVPRELAELFVDNDRRYTGEWWNAFHRFSAMLSAAPKPPESEIGPVAWVISRVSGGFRSYSPRLPKTKDLGQVVEPLYPQARIDADAAIIAALRAEGKSAEVMCDSYADENQRLFDRAEAAEARSEELERQLRDETAIVDRIWDMLGRPSYEELAGRSIYDLIAELQARAALASKKETADE